MEKLPTAEEILTKHRERYPLGLYTATSQAMIEFAKLHVKAALEAASKSVKVVHKNYKGQHNIKFPYSVDDYSDLHLDKESILNAYPENLIK